MRQSVRLELVRSRRFPDGNPNCGYDLELPLTSDSRLDFEGWQNYRHGHRARRFWAGENDRHGRLWRDHDGWFFAFGYGDASEEAAISDDDQRFCLGKLIQIVEFDGRLRTFRVVETRQLPAATAA